MRRTFAAATTAALMGLAGQAAAADYSTDGRTYFTQKADVFALPTGETVIQFTWNGVHMADDPSYPSNGAAQDCAGTVWIGADGAMTARGACTLTDKEGDVEALTFGGDHTGGTFTVTGGTGKYAGASGSGSYQPATMVADDRGILAWSAAITLE